MKQNILSKENILLNLKPMSKEEAIITAGNLLVKNGYVKENYVKSMLEKEKKCNTYIGNSIAIPHGTNDSKNEIIKSGIVVLQFKEGIDYGTDKAYLVIGIAGVNDEHLEILSKIAISIEDMDNVNKIISSNSRREICNILSINN
ncbi:MAG: PTS sugar transporter subunit IIA [Clostridium sp.]|uniref:PTS sugar transporter subunit IIA n=1 Tax=Clostridium sp. TaxID=1506 RepID=UPI003D6CEF6C